MPPAEARQLVAAEIMGGIYFEILQRIERRGYDVFTERDPRAEGRARADRAADLGAQPAVGVRPDALALGPRAVTPPTSIVIGGGCAGLSAATALAEAGARVLVLEARPGLGGRATALPIRRPASASTTASTS